MASTRPASSRQYDSSSAAPPGNRHARPTIAIGSSAAAPAPRAASARASTARFSGESFAIRLLTSDIRRAPPNTLYAQHARGLVVAELLELAEQRLEILGRDVADLCRHGRRSGDRLAGRVELDAHPRGDLGREPPHGRIVPDQRRR